MIINPHTLRQHRMVLGIPLDQMAEWCGLDPQLLKFIEMGRAPTMMEWKVIEKHYKLKGKNVER